MKELINIFSKFSLVSEGQKVVIKVLIEMVDSYEGLTNDQKVDLKHGLTALNEANTELVSFCKETIDKLYKMDN